MKSKWLPDTRILLGIFLILLSLAGVYAVINANNSKTQVYVASSPLAVGEEVNANKLRVIEANLGANIDRYLLPSQLKKAVVNRPVLAGELLPQSALLPIDDGDLAAVVLTVTGELGTDTKEGDLVDVWAASKAEEGNFWHSDLLAKTLRITRITVDGNQFDTQSSVKVEVQTDRERLPYLLDAIANQDKISLVRSSYKSVRSGDSILPSVYKEDFNNASISQPGS